MRQKEGTCLLLLLLSVLAFNDPEITLDPGSTTGFQLQLLGAFTLSLLRGNGLPAPCFSVLPRVGALAIFYLRAWGIIKPTFFLCSPTQKDNRWFLQPWIQLASVHSHSFSGPHPLSLPSLQIQHLYNEHPILNLFLKIPGVVYVFQAKSWLM